MNNTSVVGNLSVDDDAFDPTVMYIAFNGYKVTYVYFYVTITFCLFCCVVVFMNGVAATTLMKEENQTELSENFVASLAVNDALYGVTLIYNNIYNLTNIQYIIECNFRISLTWMVSLNSGCHLMVLAVDRFFKISWPFLYTRYFFKKSVIVMSLVTWLTCFVVGFLPLFGWRKYLDPEKYNKQVCILLGVTDDDFLVLFTSCFAFTIVTMTIAYVSIFKVARSQAHAIAAAEHNLNDGNNDKKTRVFDKQAWKFTKLFAVVVMLYALMSCPAGIVLLMKVTGRFENLSLIEQGELFLYSSFGVILNAIVNPIIYAVKIKVVKERFRSICCWPWCKRT